MLRFDAKSGGTPPIKISPKPNKPFNLPLNREILMIGEGRAGMINCTNREGSHKRKRWKGQVPQANSEGRRRRIIKAIQLKKWILNVKNKQVFIHIENDDNNENDNDDNDEDNDRNVRQKVRTFPPSEPIPSFIPPKTNRGGQKEGLPGIPILFPQHHLGPGRPVSWFVP